MIWGKTVSFSLNVKISSMPLRSHEGASNMNKTKPTMMVLLLGLTLLVSAMYIVGAKAVRGPVAGINAILPQQSSFIGDDDGDGVPDDVEQQNLRTVSVQQSGSEFQIESTLKNSQTQDQMEIQFRPNGDGLGVSLQYQSESVSSEVELSIEVLFRKIVEYVDINANGVYDAGVDTFIKEVFLNSFAPASYSVLVIDGANVHYIHIATSDGVFSIHAYVPEEFTIVNGTLVTPTQVKFDIEINGFTYSDGSSDLALYTRLSSEGDYETKTQTEDESSGYASGESEVETADGGHHTAIFSWATTATIDGITKPVGTTSLATDDDMGSEQKMYICYPHGTNIYHDPKVGVAGVIQAPFNWILVIVIGGAAAAAIFVGVVIAKKRR
jgi:hypothetical protein